MGNEKFLKSKAPLKKKPDSTIVTKNDLFAS